MPGIDPLKRITLLYHFTDRRNLPSIRKHGGLYPATKLAKKQIEVPAPGGNDWSRDADGMKGVDAYIHVCFRATHPMEYVARAEGRIGGRRPKLKGQSTYRDRSDGDVGRKNSRGSGSTFHC